MFRQEYRVCFCFRRVFKWTIAEPPEDVKDLFYHYSRNELMTMDEFRTFLVDNQGEEKATIEDVQDIYASLKDGIRPRRGLPLSAFFRYLFGDLNLPLPRPKVYQDMNAPLAHYFLYTGHNSYLTGNQLGSDSSVIPIIRALKKGVRVIELDLWPNSSNDGIDVYHGMTLTSPVELSKCLQAIRENAFLASDYPVIITLEDHLDAKLQDKVAKMVRQTFGDMLFFPESEFLHEFPSPEFLKRRVLISDKPPKELPETMRVKKVVQKNEFVENEDEEKASPEYKSLIAIRAWKTKGGHDGLLDIDPINVRRLSLSETELENAVKSHGTDVVRFTQRNLLRVYPKGMRISSSNYNPLPGWTHGAQVVAVNMQGYDKNLWITHGMFRANGGCGYVKKPEFLLNVGPNNEVFDPRSLRPIKTTLKVKVFMGDGWHLDFPRTYFDLCSPPDFFVKLHIAGVPADEAKGQTRPIGDEWFPVWKEEFEFPLSVPELAILRIVVRDFDMEGRHGFGGQTCLPVSELRTGIRAVPLHNKKGEKYNSVKLLMRFQFV